MLGDVQYFIAADNPHLKGLQDIRVRPVRKARVTDETIRLAVLPGKGILAVQIHSKHPFVTLSSPQAAPIAARPYGFRPQEFLGYVRIDPAADAKETKCQIGLTRGSELTRLRRAVREKAS